MGAWGRGWALTPPNFHIPKKPKPQTPKPNRHTHHSRAARGVRPRTHTIRTRGAQELVDLMEGMGPDPAPKKPDPQPKPTCTPHAPLTRRRAQELVGLMEGDGGARGLRRRRRSLFRRYETLVVHGGAASLKRLRRRR